MEISGDKHIDPVETRKQLDEILAREITAFVELDTDVASMSFNLASISCIILMVEREREIKQYPDSPPERFDEESFQEELTDIGLDMDENLEQTLNSLIRHGYITQKGNGDLGAGMPGFMMAGLLDSMFPGMPGLNLIAFVLQMNDEVNSGRKTLELAKQSFESTLKSRGVQVNRDSAQKLATDMASGATKQSVQSKQISAKLKQNNLKRLSGLMKTRKRSESYTSRMVVRDVFDKGPTKEEIAAQKAEALRKEQEAQKAADLARQLAEKEEKIKQSQEEARKAEEQLKALEKRQEELRIAREKAAELEEKEALMAQREAELKAMEERIRQEEEQARERQAQREAEAAKQETQPGPVKSQADDDIESRIAEFESDLSTPCPLCASGKVVTKTTEKGKDYFSCSNPDCRFVSWEMPYHFECPLCKNPFLTETTGPSGEKGLKCPRAACAYSQNNLLDPRQNMAAPPVPAKKKKRVVRRKKKG